MGSPHRRPLLDVNVSSHRESGLEGLKGYAAGTDKRRRENRDMFDMVGSTAHGTLVDEERQASASPAQPLLQLLLLLMKEVHLRFPLNGWLTSNLLLPAKNTRRIIVVVRETSR